MLQKPSEVDSLTDTREWLIKRRNIALNKGEFEDAVAFSHTIAWLYWAIKAEKLLEHIKESHSLPDVCCPE